MNVSSDKGLLIVLSGPSGVGKGTVCTALCQASPELVYSVSATTRLPREHEQDGANYFFKSKADFRSMIEQDQLLEWAEYANHYYGTPRKFVEATIQSGKDVILEIEVQGALQVKRNYPEGVFIFLMPPTIEELRNRITMRGTESAEIIEQRMAIAHHELNMIEQYDYAVVNDQIDRAVERIQSIIAAEHMRKERVLPLVMKQLFNYSR